MALGLGEVLEKDNLQHFHFPLSFISFQARNLTYSSGLGCTQIPQPNGISEPHPQGQSKLLCLRSWHCIHEETAVEPVSFTRDGGIVLTAAIKASATSRGQSLALDTPRA